MDEASPPRGLDFTTENTEHAETQATACGNRKRHHGFHGALGGKKLIRDIRAIRGGLFEDWICERCA
jgi:hypothetical protein